MDPHLDPGGPKIYGSDETGFASGSATLPVTAVNLPMILSLSGSGLPPLPPPPLPLVPDSRTLMRAPDMARISLILAPRRPMTEPTASFDTNISKRVSRSRSLQCGVWKIRELAGCTRIIYANERIFKDFPRSATWRL
jgi:hypothetical protein